MKLTKIYDGVADYEQSFALINRGYEPDQFFAGQWFETTEEVYWYFLEVLPPLDFYGAGFSLCEFASGYLTNAFMKFRGRYYCVTIERKNAADFEAWVGAMMREQAAIAA